MREPTVLILGCGIGGVAAARELRRLLPATHHVVVIDRESLASYPPSYLKVMTGRRRPNAISRDRGRLSHRGIEVVLGDVNLIDLPNRYVRAGGREFRYDYLVIALGAELTFDTKPGLAEAAQSFYTLEGAERLAAALRYFAGGRIALITGATPSQYPLLPYEAAMLLEHNFHERHMRQKVEIELHTPDSMPLGIAGYENSEAVLGLLAHRGIAFRPNRVLVSVDTTKHVAHFSDGETSAFDLLIAVPEQRAPAPVREAGLIDDTGWIPVDGATMETAHEDVFAIGDVTSVTLPNGTLLPKAGVFAEEQGRVVAHNIAYRLNGGPQPDPFDGRCRFFLEVGAGAASLVSGRFLGSARGIDFKQPSVIWHWAKLAQERSWLWRTYR